MNSKLPKIIVGINRLEELMVRIVIQPNIYLFE